MEGIFIFILMGSGAVLIWKRIRGEPAGASSIEEAFGVLLFLLFGGTTVFMLLIWLLFQIFPAMKHDHAMAFLVLLLFGASYLWALLRFSDWVTAGRTNNGQSNKK
jgi:hypothetical protein